MHSAVPLEIECKYLIRMPDEILLDRLAERRDAIVQTYLLPAEPDTTERIRRRGNEYTHTVKRRLTGRTREEYEEAVTEERYAQLMGRADPACSTVYKTRWCVPFEGHTLEIDRFSFWTDRAILEVELQDENEEFRLPDWLTVIREVSDDDRYTNRALSRRVPYEQLPGSLISAAANPLKRTWAEIHLENIEHNFLTLQSRLPEGCRCLGVVKADAYGHGALAVAGTLERIGCTYLAVACIDEAAALRAGGIRTPILILGPTPAECTEDLIRLDITQAVGNAAYAAELNAAAGSGVLKVHAKLETGMGRTGFPANEDGLAELITAMALPQLDFEGVFTHFAMADVPGDPYTAQQYERFRSTYLAAEQASGRAFRIHHCENSGAVIHTPLQYGEDLARPGVALYGLYPDSLREGPQLKPVMVLKSRIAAVTRHRAGDTIGYGRTYTCPRDMRIAVLPIGYADGLHRALSNKLEVEIGGKRVRQIGRICMDLCMLDITDLPETEVNAGTVATVFGGLVEIDELAEKAGTIHYELCCAVSPRVPRVLFG